MFDTPSVRSALGGILLLATALPATGTLAQMSKAPPSSDPSGSGTSETPEVSSHPHVGLWVTDDGRVRHRLLPNGRYDEARGSLKSAYRGRYEVAGDHIEYWDDTGFTADGDFVDADTLHHGGMVLRRRP